jgi:alpha-amylase/alpha-mannosidase (GH57 family)
MNDLEERVMKRQSFTFIFAFAIVFFLSACGKPKPDENLLYVNLLWHQHQPLYYKSEDGVYTRPWVRVHATKDYYDMASILEDYPDVHVTFNLTPVLIRQLDDFVQNEAKDIYWVLSEKPASDLTSEDKTFILQRFFDVNWDNIISRFPRYKALLDKRGGTDSEAIASALDRYTETDFRDLQVWFNLAWFDPDFLGEEPLNTLVSKGDGFNEEDKVILFDQVLKVMEETLPLHKELQDKGQIEVITTPYAHPILPLIMDTDLALVGNPDADMPATRFSYQDDAIAHLELSVEIYKNHFDQTPQGLWPGEGSVAEAIVPLVSNAGYQWMATGEPVLAQSLGIGSFTRNAKETVNEADALYRPYYVQGESGDKVAVFFRDHVISDRIGFTYADMSGELAAQDLIDRLEAIDARLDEEGSSGPHIVSIIMDGENAWEYYKNDGKEFFHALYTKLSESTTLKTVTPSEYLEYFPEQREIEDLFPGAWFSPNYDTWIGETEERLAWEYLARVRSDLADFDIHKTRQAEDTAIALALDYMYLAEGSDWFWWYGGDQDSGQDDYFDEGFRALLAKVYEAVGDPVPDFVQVPIVQRRPAEPVQSFSDLSTPTIDGTIEPGEWDQAAAYPSVVGIPETSLFYALDTDNLYVRLDLEQSLDISDGIGFYLKTSRGLSFPFSRADEGSGILLGFAATHLFEWQSGEGLRYFNATGSGWQSRYTIGKVAVGEGTIEFSIPLEEIGEVDAGDDLFLTAILQPAGQSLPAEGPVRVAIPEMGETITIVEVVDPEGDDHGPGAFTYPTDEVYKEQTFDLKSFEVAHDEENMYFRFNFFGRVLNPWGSPNNLALQTLDVYVDIDPGAGTGARMLLPGRNAALTSGNGWDIALWAEGWTPQILAPDPDSKEPKPVSEVDFRILVNPASGVVTLRVPKSLFGEGDPTEWGYAAAVLSQEGYPSTGVWRVRDVGVEADQWLIGGGTGESNQTRIMDLGWSVEHSPTQEEMLSNYPGSLQSIETLSVDDFAKIELIMP